MPKYFQDRIGNSYPFTEGLCAVAASATMVAKGEDTLRLPTTEKILMGTIPSCARELEAVNNHTLRAIIECVVREDKISIDAARSLSSFTFGRNQDYANDASFICAHLKEAESKTLASLADELAPICNDPQLLIAHLNKKVNFSRFPPESLGSEHVLLEDTFARCAVSVLLQGGDRNLEIAQRIARIALAFRSNLKEAALSRRFLRDERDKADSKAFKIECGLNKLVDMARNVRDSLASPAQATPVVECLEELSKTFNCANSLASLSFFIRCELLAKTKVASDLIARIKDKNTEEALQELQMVSHVLHTPTEVSVNTLGTVMAMVSGHVGDLCEQNEDIEIFPSLLMVLKGLR